MAASVSDAPISSSLGPIHGAVAFEDPHGMYNLVPFAAFVLISIAWQIDIMCHTLLDVTAHYHPQHLMLCMAVQRVCLQSLREALLFSAAQ